MVDYVYDRKPMGLPFSIREGIMKIRNPFFTMSDCPQSICELLPQHSLWTDSNEPGSVYFFMLIEADVSQIAISRTCSNEGKICHLEYEGVVNTFQHIIGLMLRHEYSEQSVYRMNYKAEEGKLIFEPITDNILNLPLEWIRIEKGNPLMEDFKKLYNEFNIQSKCKDDYSIIPNSIRIGDTKENRIIEIDIAQKCNNTLGLPDLEISTYKYIDHLNRFKNIHPNDEIILIYANGEVNLLWTRISKHIPFSKLSKIEKNKKTE